MLLQYNEDDNETGGKINSLFIQEQREKQMAGGQGTHAIRERSESILSRKENRELCDKSV